MAPGRKWPYLPNSAGMTALPDHQEGDDSEDQQEQRHGSGVRRS